MNKKIFTLLAGTFLMLATVFMVSAQTLDSYIDFQELHLGDPVEKLVNGANPGYFHLKLDAIGSGAPFDVNPTNYYNSFSEFSPSLEITNIGNPGGVLMTLDDDLLLYMGILQTDPGPTRGTYPLFIDRLNAARTNFPDFFSDGTLTTKAEESAAALWCTIVNDYNQGKGITFDFVNKHQRDIALDVEAGHHATWTSFTETNGASGRESYGTTNGHTFLAPGSVSGWAFSEVYATGLDQGRPLVSFIKPDTVAVLCVSSTYEVYIKIAAADDVYDGSISEVGYFTLYEAEPFTISAKDFNTMFGRNDNDDDAYGKLKFNPTVKGGATNIFEQDLKADDIDRDRIVILNIEDAGAGGLYPNAAGIGTGGTLDFYIEDVFDPSVTYTPVNAYLHPLTYAANPVLDEFNIVLGKGSNLTDLGYIHLMTKANSNNYVYVRNQYYTDQPAGSRFLDFGTRGIGGYSGTNPGAKEVVYNSGYAIPYDDTMVDWTPPTAGDPSMEDFFDIIGDKTSPIWTNALLFGQTVFRLVYYPSGDSIYINPYQATYRPDEYAELGYMQDPYSGDNLAWNDLYTQSSNRFTYRAYPYFLWNGAGTSAEHDYVALDPSTVDFGASNGFYDADELDAPYARMIARLKFGRNPARAGDRLEYRHYHKLYVSMQNESPWGNQTNVVTLREGYFDNHKINTHINFNIYTPCTAGSSERTTIAPDLYLIRNKLGEYLHVPLYSATDSARWVKLDPEVHPEFLPSFQWIVHKQYINSDYSPITLINREFDELKLNNIILYKDWDAPFDFLLDHDFVFNDKDVNELVVDFGEHNKPENKTATFIKLTAIPTQPNPSTGAMRNVRTDPYLGYSWFNTNLENSLPEYNNFLNLYAFKYLSGILDDLGQNRWINAPNFSYWDYPKTDTTIYVHAKNDFDKLYFRIETVDDEDVGDMQKYGYDPDTKTNPGAQVTNIAQLQRQAYRLVFEDPYKFICYHALCLRNTDIDRNGVYSLGALGDYQEFLGQPMFHFRHFYHLEGAYDQAGFVLVQRINPVTYSQSGSASADQKAAFLAYIEEIYQGYKDVVEEQIDHMQDTSLDLGFFVAAVDDQMGSLKAKLRVDAATRVSTFMLEKDEDPIYRRFNTLKEADTADDDPKVLHFFSMDNPSYELFENTGLLAGQKAYWDYLPSPEGKKNYLGVVETNQYTEANTAIYVDTAYINRGTGYIKPQYMLVVRPQWVSYTPQVDEGCTIFYVPNGSSSADPEPYEPYLRGFYLINATDSAKNASQNITDRSYIWDTKWERLVFTDAIHWNDTLYILDGADLADYKAVGFPDGSIMYDMHLLDAAAMEDDTKIIKVNLSDNEHKDVVFSMRLIERGADDFIIESESSDRIFQITPATKVVDANKIEPTHFRTNSRGPIIAPCEGGWVKFQNGAPVISRSDQVFSMPQAFRMNVRRQSDEPVANENVATAVAPIVIGNDGAVTILNAEGKKVVISNILGQQVANTVLSSDNATLAAPKGVVIVAIEGEAAVKALVK